MQNSGKETLRKPRPWYASWTTNWIMLMHYYFFFPGRTFALFKSMLSSTWMTESGKYDIGVSCRFTTSWVRCCTIGKSVAWWFQPHSICLQPDFHSAILMSCFLIWLFDWLIDCFKGTLTSQIQTITLVWSKVFSSKPCSLL